MEILSLLNNTVGIPLYGQTYDIALNWIGTLIRGLIAGVGSVGVGIILFSIILKVLVLPFDIYQRIAMRKQNIKMKENQAKMEKLQKQYANDKDKYNQKLMEMYKESGISMFSSCLPMILSLVIFIVAINAFNAYSQYANVENYNTMVKAYNTELKTVCESLDDEAWDFDEEGNDYILYVDKLYEKHPEIQTAVNSAMTADNTLTEQAAITKYFESKAQDAVVKAYDSEVIGHTSFLWIKNIWATDASYKHPVLQFNEFKTEVERQNFQVGDKTTNFSGVSEYTDIYDVEAYNKITAKLTTQKSQANGYYILIVLSIGTILLQQWISMRGQKEQQKFSSVDGQGASQQKMMMVIMTGMFAIFSFMYSSAFSIYMIMSNVLSLFSTLIINKLVDISESKKEERALQEKYNKRFPNRTATGVNGNNGKRKGS